MRETQNNTKISPYPVKLAKIKEIIHRCWWEMTIGGGAKECNHCDSQMKKFSKTLKINLI